MPTCKTCNGTGELCPSLPFGVTHIGGEKPYPCPDCNSGKPKGDELTRILADGDPDLMHLQTVETRLRYHEEAVKALTELVSDLLRQPGRSVHGARQKRLGALLGRCGIDWDKLQAWDCANLIGWGRK